MKKGKGMNVGIIGLGRIGLPIAKNLIEAGLPVMGYRRGDMNPFTGSGGVAAGSCREVAERSDVVITCLHEADFHDAFTGPSGLIYGAHNNLVVIDLSTATIEVKEQQRQALQSRQARMLDCPISGSPMMAAAKQAVLFASGEKAVYEQCLPVLEAIASNSFYLGSFGAGMKMKYIANLLLAVHNVAAAEAMVLGAKANLDPELMLNVISPSIAGSTAFTTRALMMSQGSYLPPAPGPIQTMHEVIELIDAFARNTGCPTPLFSLATRYYEQAMEEGRGEQDIAAIYALLGREAGLDML
ncbi:NAD(P)-dependent oxidoreductase [Dictyobacter aurantiacus]|nr:NAD(P)-dependent oxidoreductase [Dictyobacter aurantiacus]